MMKLSEQIKDIREYFSSDIDKILDQYFSEKRTREYLTTKSCIRMSYLPYLCPREEAICTKNKIIRTDDISTDTGMIFEFGHAFEDIVRHRAFGPSGLLVGQWECENCGYIHGAIGGIKDNGLEKRIPMPKICDVEIEGYGRCDGKSFRYVEEKIENEMFKIQGHPDGFLSNAVYDHVLEIKTVNDYRFKLASKEPFPEHKEQAMMYAFFTNKKNILLFYFNKNTGKSLYYDMKVDDTLVTQVCNRLHILWKAIRAIEKGEEFEMPARICNSTNDQRAKKCQVCSYCFSDLTI